MTLPKSSSLHWKGGQGVDEVKMAAEDRRGRKRGSSCEWAGRRENALNANVVQTLKPLGVDGVMTVL